MSLTNAPTPELILACTSARTAANNFYLWLCEWAKGVGYNTNNILLRAPGASGYDSWAVIWEEGPFEWTMISCGTTLTGPSNGIYSAPGPFPDGLHGNNNSWFAEPKNNYQLNFIQD
jgi:hypothetical protein